MRIGDDRIRYKLLYPACHIRNVVDPVVHIIHLTVSGKFTLDRLTHHFLIVFHHIRLDRHTVDRRFLQYTHIPDPDQAHMQGPRDRCRSKGQHIYILFEFFDLFFMSDTETLLFIYNQKSQIFIFHIFGQHAMGSDHNIDQPLFQIFHCLFLLCRRLEPAQQIDPNRKIFHPLHKRIVMLLCQNRRRYKVDNLFSLLHRLKRRADRDLRLSVSDVSAYKPVHDLMAFHITLCIFDRL